jgi:limonene-1,2-epoxide hydrolase
MASESEKLVNDFCQAWSRMNLDEIMGYFAEDAVYHNIPMSPVSGKPAIRQAINTFLPMAQAVKFRVLKTASASNVVFNERVDSFQMRGRRVEVPVAGVFETADGKINAWRDYFDLATWTRQTQ